MLAAIDRGDTYQLVDFLLSFKQNMFWFNGLFALVAASASLHYCVAVELSADADHCGRAAAKDLLLTARVVDAPEALRLGLVTEVLPKGELDAFVERRAADIAKLAPLSLRAAKAMVHDAPDADALYEACYESEDYAEGVRAFLERRRRQLADPGHVRGRPAQHGRHRRLGRRRQ